MICDFSNLPFCFVFGIVKYSEGTHFVSQMPLSERKDHIHPNTFAEIESFVIVTISSYKQYYFAQ